MKKTILVLLVSLCASSSFAKQLTVACEKSGMPDVAAYDNATFGAVFEIANVNADPVIKAFAIEGAAQNARVIGKSISSGPISLKLQFGKMWYSSVNLDVQNCQDSFSATGNAVVAAYVGGFAGTRQTKLTCTCELK